MPPPDVDVRLHVSQCVARADLADGERLVVKMRCETDEAVLAGADALMLGEDAAEEDGFEKEEYRVCVLIGGRCESLGVDLVLDEYAEFCVEGRAGVDLTGYYMPEFGDEDAYGDEDGMFPEDDDEDDDFEGDEDEDDSEDDDEDDSEDDDEDDDSEDDDEDDSEDDDEDDSEDDEDDDSEGDSEDDSEDEGVTRKGGVKIVELKEEKKPEEKKRPAETKPEKTPEPKKQAVEVKKPQSEAKKPEPEAKKPDTPKRVHKNGMEIINTFATKNVNAKVASGGKKVAMKYVGKLPSGKIFDQTKGNATFSFRLGVGEVIKGWDVGVEGMREGDKRTLIIPAAMGYGKKGIKGVIPGGSALHFDVELVKVF